MAMDAPVISSIQQAPDGLIQHVVVPVVAIPAWVPSAFYQMPPTSNYEAAEFCDRVWKSPGKSCETQWQRGCHGGGSAPSDCVSTKASSRPSSCHYDSDDGNESDGDADARTKPHQGCRLPCPTTQQSASSGSCVSLVLSNLPKMLCSDTCFEAALEQARLQADVSIFEVKIAAESAVGEATVVLKSEDAAQRCMRHFRGLRCAKGPAIMVRYNAAAGRCLMEKSQKLHPKVMSQADKEVLKLKRKLRDIQVLKRVPAAELDKLQTRKVSREPEILKRLRDLGVDMMMAEEERMEACEKLAMTWETASSDKQAEAEAREPSKADIRTSSSPAGHSTTSNLADIQASSSPAGHSTTSNSKSRKLWADYDSDDDTEGDCMSTLVAPPKSEDARAYTSDIDE